MHINQAVARSGHSRSGKGHPLAEWFCILYRREMSIYRIDPIGGGSGFKVHVTDDASGLRVVGVFLNETDAQAWIVADRGQARPSDPNTALEPASQA
jgi:hypothetical protein